MVKTYSGKYTPKNKSKYVGDPTNIIYRSLWERRVMVYLDECPIVKKWGSEEKVIPYKSSLDGRMHKYFMDFIVLVVHPDGTRHKYLLEIKPKSQTVPPKKPKRVTKGYRLACEAYIRNMDKWTATLKYCETNNYMFKIITEDHLKHMTIF